MKKRNMAALLLFTVMLLTACGRAADTAVTTEEMVVPEMSSEDILVNSLEYLLEEENGEETEETAGPEGETLTDKSVTEDSEAQGEDEEQKETAVICFGRDLDSGLTREEITAEEITPDILLGALGRHNIVPLLDTKAFSVEEREEDGRKILYLDLSSSIREYLQTMSMEAECIIISSIVNTFMENYDADSVYITVEGEILSTAHAEYTEAVPGYTPGELMAFLKAAENGEEDAAEPETE